MFGKLCGQHPSSPERATGCHRKCRTATKPLRRGAANLARIASYRRDSGVGNRSLGGQWRAVLDHEKTSARTNSARAAPKDRRVHYEYSGKGIPSISGPITAALLLRFVPIR